MAKHFPMTENLSPGCISPNNLLACNDWPLCDGTKRAASENLGNRFTPSKASSHEVYQHTPLQETQRSHEVYQHTPLPETQRSKKLCRGRIPLEDITNLVEATA